MDCTHTKTNRSSSSDWQEVDATNHCPICGHDTWCRVAPDKSRVACRREPIGGTRKRYKDGSEYFLHVLSDDRPGSNGHARPKSKSKTTVVADADTLDRAYRMLLDGLELSPAHRDDLHRRGLSDDAIDANLYRTLPDGTGDLAVGMLTRLGGDVFDSIPGLLKTIGPVRVNAKPGLLIPVRDHGGRIIALKVRPDDRGKGAKYQYVTSRTKKRPKAPSPGSPAHVPPGITGPCDVVRITEGELKADVATHLSGVPTVSFPGVTTWRKILPVLETLQARTVRVAFDADAATNEHVAKALCECCAKLRKCGHVVELEQWPLEAGKGIDDLLVNGGTPEILTGDAMESAVDDDDKTVVVVGMDEAKVAADTLAALGNLGWDDESGASLRIYQRVGQLVHVTETADAPVSGLELPERMLRIRPLPLPIVRERIASAVKLEGPPTKDGEPTYIRPPGWLVNAIHQRGQYPRDIRPLAGIVRCPTLRPDGTVIQTPGYDDSTGLLFVPDGNYPNVPDHPTRDDAIRAAAELLDVVVDFPFKNADHRSVWLAMVLTLVCRSAIRGPCPMFMTDANCPGTGKTMTNDAAGVIAYGDRLPRKPWPGADDNEVRKTITSVALEGLAAVLWDNVGDVLGSPSLDAGLTGTSWTDRILGTNSTTGVLPLTTVWCATGNNMVLGADTARRVLYCRLETDMDNPEERQGFRHENLIGWVRDHRHRLAVAAVTMVRAYAAARFPRQNIKPWGSYEAWSDLIRNTIVWAGIPDPWKTRTIVREADRSVELLGLIHDGIVEADPDGVGITSGQIVKLLDDQHPKLCAAVTELCGAKIDARRIGYALRSYVGRVRAGRRLNRDTAHDKVARWVVRSVSRPCTGGDEGDGGDDSHSSRAREFAELWANGEVNENGNGPGTFPPSPASPPPNTSDSCQEVRI